MEAKLHTAISSLLVYSIISVHKFEHLMVPRFCWLLFLFAESLYSMYGVPVSICDSIMADQSFWALTVSRPLFSRSYLSYKASNSSPQTSASPGHSFGHISVQFSSFSTLFMNKSGIHRA
ncbi:hypothetical protein BpHYR1_023803 [Brachionus plicatilis]|uniref:Uncharacterized protein n=1 Tax=Brachionus plicatilis TaxID=10195 RepID=A0A3M7PDK1_BRAPC|nr:hypothetical protein BpHYR1_023803 [Brachionus plicatilis]